MTFLSIKDHLIVNKSSKFIIWLTLDNFILLFHITSNKDTIFKKIIPFKKTISVCYYKEGFLAITEFNHRYRLEYFNAKIYKIVYKFYLPKKIKVKKILYRKFLILKFWKNFY